MRVTKFENQNFEAGGEDDDDDESDRLVRSFVSECQQRKSAYDSMVPPVNRVMSTKWNTVKMGNGLLKFEIAMHSTNRRAGNRARLNRGGVGETPWVSFRSIIDTYRRYDIDSRYQKVLKN